MERHRNEEHLLRHLEPRSGSKCAFQLISVSTWHCRGSVIGFELAQRRERTYLATFTQLFLWRRRLFLLLVGQVRGSWCGARCRWRCADPEDPGGQCAERAREFQSVAPSHLCSQHVLTCSARASPIDELGYLVQSHSVHVHLV